MSNQLIDHLFRHQFGKMVSILTKIFGFEHLETIEDAVQDTFVQAMKTWRNGIPENPEAWLTAAAKNRVIDIFRSIQSEKNRTSKLSPQPDSAELDELFLDHEIEDSQLRMIFTACHPKLSATEQIAFALRTISGFSIQEIAAALLIKQETIKKRLQRARKMIASENIAFEIPVGVQLSERMDRVLEVIYVIFNEGFHSNKKELVTRKELCGEAMRLVKLMLIKNELQLPKVYALFALMCFHSARLDSKVNADNELVRLSHQDRSKWYFPLIMLGNESMNQAVQMTEEFSSYHYEAAIAAEHVRAPSFESTNWKSIAKWYEQLYLVQYSAYTQLNLAIVYMQLNQLNKAKELLDRINPTELAQKVFLLDATRAEYYHVTQNSSEALKHIGLALKRTTNPSEKKYFMEKQKAYQTSQ